MAPEQTLDTVHDAAAMIRHALALQQAGRIGEAEQAYRQVIAAQPRHPDALHLAGLCAYQRGQAREAITLLARAIDAAPDNAVILNNLSAIWLACREATQALACANRALALQPGYADAWINHGNALQLQRRNEEALASFARAQQLGHRSVALHYNRANLLLQLGRFEDALADYQAALALAPHDPNIWHNLGALQDQMGLLDEACRSFERAIALHPGIAYTRGHLLFAKLRSCDWQGLHQLTAQLLSAVDAGQRPSEPFPLLAIASTPQQQLRAARAYMADKFPPAAPVAGLPAHPRGQRLRVGYFSADFHDHATAHLIAEVFEKHDRSQFECFAFSFGPHTGDAWQQRLAADVEHFVEVQGLSDAAILEQARALHIDIAVDLKGHTQHARTGLFTARVAPVQVNFLGYPGTMGSRCMDYLMADPVVVPPEEADCYDENIAWLSDCYQPNDASKTIATTTPSRAELGLPDDGFVFCCFNNPYKITPEVFDVWMRLLQQVDGSVLWLLDNHPRSTANLRREAQQRGVDPQRLVFAPRLPLAEHLARHRQADLFLDTFDYNAHTTASDALWAGLPVLTRRGGSFAGRVAASLLTAVGLPQLITADTAGYERLAQALARDPKRLRDLRQQLADQRLTRALFDSTRFTLHLETAYQRMAARHFAGQAPTHIDLRVVAEQG